MENIAADRGEDSDKNAKETGKWRHRERHNYDCISNLREEEITTPRENHPKKHFLSFCFEEKENGKEENENGRGKQIPRSRLIYIFLPDNWNLKGFWRWLRDSAQVMQMTG